MQLILLILIATPTTYSFIGFDCGGRHLNITSVSLLDVGECNLNIKNPSNSTVFIQLLQLSDYSHTEVIQCKVEISRLIYHCGMHSHISAVHNGQANYVHETGYTTCMRMFHDGTLSLGPESLLTALKANSTNHRSITLAGRISNDGTCKGAQYSDPYGTWDDVIVQAGVTITLKSSYVPVQLNPGRIKLRSGFSCPLADSFCLDSDDGYSYWKPMPTSSCNFNQYDVLYEGPATKLEATDGESTPPIYSLVTEDITFALTTTKKHPLCGYTLLRTEHPKLFILEVQQGDTFSSKSNVPIHNLDIFTYMNSKFVYVEKHMRTQMISLYRNVIKQKCELERQVITNTLSFATLQPDEFAYKLMKGPGYMAVTAGEAVHIVKCIPVEATLRKIEKCYNELPVTVRNASLYLTPKSRILTKFGNERECSNELPTLYRIEDTWIQFTPKPQMIQIPPQQLQPLIKLSWNYSVPGPLAISGIYSEKDIEKLRNHIMFPAERPALLNEIARRINGYPINPNDFSVYNLIDEASLNKIVDSATSRIWNGFISFGSATAGVIGIFMIIRIVKLIIDTTIHGYALHTVYGCSLHLLGAVWSSITHLLLHLAKGPPNRRNPSDNPTNTPSSIEIAPAITSHSAATAPLIISQPTAVHRTNSTIHPIVMPRKRMNPVAASRSVPYSTSRLYPTAALQTISNNNSAALQTVSNYKLSDYSTAALPVNSHSAALQNCLYLAAAPSVGPHPIAVPRGKPSLIIEDPVATTQADLRGYSTVALQNVINPSAPPQIVSCSSVADDSTAPPQAAPRSKDADSTEASQGTPYSNVVGNPTDLSQNNSGSSISEHLVTTPQNIPRAEPPRKFIINSAAATQSTPAATSCENSNTTSAIYPTAPVGPILQETADGTQIVNTKPYETIHTQLTSVEQIPSKPSGFALK